MPSLCVRDAGPCWCRALGHQLPSPGCALAGSAPPEHASAAWRLPGPGPARREWPPCPPVERVYLAGLHLEKEDFPSSLWRWLRPPRLAGHAALAERSGWLRMALGTGLGQRPATAANTRVPEPQQTPRRACPRASLRLRDQVFLDTGQQVPGTCFTPTCEPSSPLKASSRGPRAVSQRTPAPPVPLHAC